MPDDGQDVLNQAKTTGRGVLRVISSTNNQRGMKKDPHWLKFHFIKRTLLQQPFSVKWAISYLPQSLIS